MRFYPAIQLIKRIKKAMQNLPELNIEIKTALNFDSPYAAVESLSRLAITNSKEGMLEAVCEKPLGVKFMGMTVASVSQIKMDKNGEIIEKKLDAPFLVKKQIENEIAKAVKRLPYGIVEMYLAKAGLENGAKIKVEIAADKSVKVESDTPIKAGRPPRELKNFKILPNGEVEGENINLSSKAWEFFQNCLS
ncbi:MAG: hypothetical protein J6P03_07480 [Opitutales bacterium]|nr:hypothetical protein [Opitutales bacterium]